MAPRGRYAALREIVFWPKKAPWAGWGFRSGSIVAAGGWAVGPLHRWCASAGPACSCRTCLLSISEKSAEGIHPLGVGCEEFLARGESPIFYEIVDSVQLYRSRDLYSALLGPGARRQGGCQALACRSVCTTRVALAPGDHGVRRSARGADRGAVPGRLHFDITPKFLAMTRGLADLASDSARAGFMSPTASAIGRTRPLTRTAPEFARVRSPYLSDDRPPFLAIRQKESRVNGACAP
jgi:hypothetical protein